jgi:hypothetical protein
MAAFKNYLNNGNLRNFYLERLKKKGYDARAHNESDSHIVVQDPVHVSSGSKKWIEYTPKILHYKDVEKFISDRS